MRKTYKKLALTENPACKKAQGNYNAHCIRMKKNSQTRCNLMQKYWGLHPKCSEACFNSHVSNLAGILTAIAKQQAIITDSNSSKKVKAAAQLEVKRLNDERKLIPNPGIIANIVALDVARTGLVKTQEALSAAIFNITPYCELPPTTFAVECQKI